jgi:hypothetical protein
MTKLRRAAIVSPLRTAVGEFQGALAPMQAGDLGAVILKALTRPHRRIFLLQSALNTEHPYLDMRFYEQHVKASPPEGDIYAMATCESMNKACGISVTDQLRLYLLEQTRHDQRQHRDITTGLLLEFNINAQQSSATPPL